MGRADPHGVALRSLLTSAIAVALWVTQWGVLGLAGCSSTELPFAAPPRATAAMAPPSGAPPPAPAKDPAYAEPLSEPIEDGAIDAREVVPSRVHAERRGHPLDGLQGEELERLVDEAFESLGSLSLGSPNAGRLLNGVQLPEASEWERVDPVHAWGTSETIEYLSAAARLVHQVHDDTPVLFVGHISARGGGPLSPHVSHQSGRDVDVSFYYVGSDSRWYQRGTAANLDLTRTWTFVRALLTVTDVELILADRSILRLLEEHALSRGEDPSWVEGLFRDRNGQRAILRHASGHKTHLHIRFFNPIAQETARRLYPILVDRGLAAPPVTYRAHRCASGDTLGKLAKRYGTTIPDIKRANGLRSSKIIAGKTYRIPQRGVFPAPVVVPPRRLPPTAQ